MEKYQNEVIDRDAQIRSLKEEIDKHKIHYDKTVIAYENKITELIHDY